jgi:hypothetical protein
MRCSFEKSRRFFCLLKLHLCHFFSLAQSVFSLKNHLKLGNNISHKRHMVWSRIIYGRQSLPQYELGRVFVQYIISQDWSEWTKKSPRIY